MEMSLDEIIQSTRSLDVRRDGGSSSRGGNVGGADRPIRKGGRPTPTNTQRQGGISGGNGGILKGRNRGGIQKSKFSKGEVNGAWKRDMYDGPKCGGPIKTTGGSFGGSTKLFVSNLDYSVSELDIHELFSELGPLRRASIHYDRYGRSLGTANIVFQRRADAVKAMRQYNEVRLDGRPMKIQLLTSELPSLSIKAGLGSVAIRPSDNARRGAVGGPQRRRSDPRPSGGSATSERRNAAKTSTLTAEELDAQLDAYLNDIQ